MKWVHVAVGVIQNNSGKILIAKRPDGVHQGGLWEFPGGKVESNESLFHALQRELQEELDIHIFNSVPLIKIQHDYGDKQVVLDVHWVREFDDHALRGKKYGREGQPIEWVDVGDLNNYPFPAANRPIIHAIQLPQWYGITGDTDSADDLISRVANGLQKGIKLIQLRADKLDFSAYQKIATQLISLCENHGANLQLNLPVEKYLSLNVSTACVGLHLKACELMTLEQRPIGNQQYLSASCHNEVEIQQAKKIGVDFICLSPVQATKSHPNAELLGWEKFSTLAAHAACPTFALGGLSEKNLDQAIEKGAQGVAGIGFWWL